MKKIHEKYINLCLTLAKRGIGKTLPNPLVGCVIVKNNKIIGKGYHKKYGGSHAEVNAIKNATEDVKGATLYVNLEPCSHYGKTPPCVDLIIKKGIKKVVIGMRDPNPLVNGKGIDKLRENGIEVVEGVLKEKCMELNEVFIKNITKRESFINLKLAATLDGKIAQSDGFSKWITNEHARKIVHRLRYSCDAILVGANTVRVDNPDLNARQNGKVLKYLKKLIMTNSFNFSEDLKVFKNREYVYFLTNSTKIPEKFKKYKIIYFKDVNEIPALLYKNEIFNVIVEGGSKVSYLFLKNFIVDKVYFFYSNKILGGKDSISMIEGDEEFSLKNPIYIEKMKIKQIYDNFLITGCPCQN